MALAVALALAFGPAVAEAKPPAPEATGDQGAADLARKAEGLLAKLEYERAREALEAGVRSQSLKSARPTARAMLWALLGRARAEIGDAVAADDAFAHAVALDVHVKLARSTSPKILDALERARANAPAPGEAAEGPAKTEAPAKTEPAKADVRSEPKAEVKPRVEAKAEPKPKTEDRGEPAKARAKAEPTKLEVKAEPTKVEVKAEPAKVETAKGDAKDKVKAEAKVDAKADPKDKARNDKPLDPKKLVHVTGPSIRHRVIGEVKAGRTVTLVVEEHNLPKGTKLELEMRRAQTAGYKLETLTKTGTVATKKITMDRPRVELYIRAVQAKKVIAQLGSPDDPIVITTLAPAPTLADAWSTPDHRPNLVKTSSTSTLTATRPPPTLTLAKTERATTEVNRSLTVQKPAESDHTMLWVGLGVGGALLVAGVVVLAVVLGSSKGDNACSSQPGFGCAEIRVSP